MISLVDHPRKAHRDIFSVAERPQKKNSSVSAALVRGLRSCVSDASLDARYIWDAENRMTGIQNAVNATYKYDALGRRVQKSVTENAVTTTTTFVCGGAQVFTEYVDNVEKQSYVYASYVDDPVALIAANGDRSFYHQNHLFSTEVVTDSLGAIVETADYNSYGKVTLKDNLNNIIASSTVENKYYFTGRRLDSESGLYYFRARYFDADLGRFISRDPKNSGISAGGYHDGYGQYGAYFIPNYVDPLGMDCESDCKAGLKKNIDRAIDDFQRNITWTVVAGVASFFIGGPGGTTVALAVGSGIAADNLATAVERAKKDFDDCMDKCPENTPSIPIPIPEPLPELAILNCKAYTSSV